MTDPSRDLLREIFSREHEALFEFIGQAGCVRPDASMADCELQACMYAHQCAAKLSATLTALQYACDGHFEAERLAMERHASPEHLRIHLEAHGALQDQLKSVYLYAQTTRDMRGAIDEVGQFARRLTLHIDTVDAEMGREIPGDVTLESIRGF